MQLDAGRVHKPKVLALTLYLRLIPQSSSTLAPPPQYFCTYYCMLSPTCSTERHSLRDENVVFPSPNPFLHLPQYAFQNPPW